MWSDDDELLDALAARRQRLWQSQAGGLARSVPFASELAAGAGEGGAVHLSGCSGDGGAAEGREPESFTWSILQEANWRKDGHLGWRFSKGELQKRAEAAAASASKRARC